MKELKEHLWDLLLYAIVFGIVLYKSYGEGDWGLTLIATIFFIGFANVAVTVLGILWHGVVWFWNATVNYNKNRRKNTEYAMED
jgi:hypothetical protein